MSPESKFGSSGRGPTPAAKAALAEAEANELKAAKSMMADVMPFLSSDQLDAKLVKCALLAEATPIAVAPKELSRILHSESGANTLITLTLDGESHRVMVKEYQLDPVSHGLLHADFYKVAMDKAITVTVPIVLRGESPGVKQQGGLLDFVHREIEVECLPRDIPEHIEVDVSNLMLNQAIRLRELVAGREPALRAGRCDSDPLFVCAVAVAAMADPAGDLDGPRLGSELSAPGVPPLDADAGAPQNLQRG